MMALQKDAPSSGAREGGAAPVGALEAVELKLRRASDRGRADYGWLKTAYTFSFADYHDAAWMGFRTLRVINDDWIAPGGGFGTHPHRDMEIFSYVLQGAIEHKDSMGNGRILRPGQIQMMSAGRGVSHSEFNPSASEPLHLLQIWIRPGQFGLEPGYSEWSPRPEDASVPKLLVISPDGRDRSAVIHQDAEVYRLRLGAGATVTHDLRPGRGAWLQIAEGDVAFNGVLMSTGDGAGVDRPGRLTFLARAATEALLFDLG